MPRRDVHISGEYDASADAVWNIAREFCGLWHPLIETCTAEHGDIRRFTVKGETNIYREQLTSFSDDNSSYSYKHLEGIQGVENYEATLTVSPTSNNSCRLDWRATLEALEPRATAIAEGTAFVFQTGINAIRDLLPHNIFLQTDPTIALTIAGKPTDALCLFLHGIGGNKSNWSQQLSTAASVMQTASMDLRGYGDSKLGIEASTIENYCDDILATMEQRKATRLVLCGLSYGSWIATSFAMRHPEKLAGLMLCGGCTGMSEASAEERNRFRITREMPLNEGKTPKDFAPAVVNVIAGPHASDDVRQQLYDSMAAIPVATYRDALYCFTHPKEQFAFSKLTMPTLFITGEHDKLASPQEIRAVSQRVKIAAPSSKMQFEILPDAGHVCNLENPKAFNQLLSDFLRSISQ